MKKEVKGRGKGLWWHIKEVSREEMTQFLATLRKMARANNKLKIGPFYD